LRQLYEHLTTIPNGQIYRLGTPQIELDGAPITIRRSNVLALLAYLAVSGETQRRATLATLL
jgi:DNA-binding SARP family transcriptional activator